MLGATSATLQRDSRHAHCSQRRMTKRTTRTNEETRPVELRRDSDDHALREGTHDEKAHTVALVRDFSIALLTTFDPGPNGWAPRSHTRPMTMLRVDDDGTTYFVAARDTVSTPRAKSRRRALLTLQSTLRFAAIEGRLDVRDDHALLRDIWTKGCDAFFDGPADPRAVALVFRPEKAETWDAAGFKGLRFVFEAAKALITGEKRVPEHPEQHLVVDMAR
jgi:general stress protein 26